VVKGREGKRKKKGEKRRREEGDGGRDGPVKRVKANVRKVISPPVCP